MSALTPSARSSCGCVVMALALAACTGSPVPPVESWMVRAEPAGNPVPAQSDAILRIADIGVAPHIRGLTVIRADGRVDTLVYHQWAAPVSHMVEDCLRTLVEQRGLFRAVVGTRENLLRGPEHVLDLQVSRFEFEERPDGDQARVRLRGVVTRPDGTPQVVGPYDATASLVEAAGPALPKSMQSALETALAALIRDLDPAAAR